MVNIKLPKKSTYFSSNSISHVQMQNELFDYVMQPTKVFGGELFDKGYTMVNTKMILLIILCSSTVILNAYDIYAFSDDMARCVFCLLTFSAGIQSFSKLYCFIWRREDIHDLRQRTEGAYKRLRSHKSSESFENKLMQATHVVAGLTLLYIATYILISIYPIILYYILGKRILHFGIEIPFVDWKESYFGYALNFTHHMSILTVFFCGSTAALGITIILMANVFGQFLVIEQLLDDLNKLALQNVNGRNDRKIRKLLRFLIDAHHELTDYIEKLTAVLGPYYLAEFTALIFQKTVVIFSIITVNIPTIFCRYLN